MGARVTGLVLLALIVPRLDMASVVGRLATLRIETVPIAAVLFAGLIGLRSWQWHQIIRLFGGRSSILIAFASLWTGFFWGMVTPGHVGEFARALHVSRLGVRGGAAVLSVVVERSINLWVLLVLAGIALFTVAAEVSAWQMVLGGLLGCVAMGGVIRTALCGPALRLLERKLGPLRPGGLAKQVGGALLEQATRLARVSVGTWLWQGVLSLAGWVITGYLVWILSRGAGLSLSWPDSVGYMAVGSAAAALPISVLGLGTRDAALILLFARGGRSWEEAVTFSSLLLLITVANLLTGLVVWYASSRLLLVGGAPQSREP